MRKGCQSWVFYCALGSCLLSLLTFYSPCNDTVTEEGILHPSLERRSSASLKDHLGDHLEGDEAPKPPKRDIEPLLFELERDGSPAQLSDRQPSRVIPDFNVQTASQHARQVACERFQEAPVPDEEDERLPALQIQFPTSMHPLLRKTPRPQRCLAWIFARNSQKKS